MYDWWTPYFLDSFSGRRVLLFEHTTCIPMDVVRMKWLIFISNYESNASELLGILVKKCFLSTTLAVLITQQCERTLSPCEVFPGSTNYYYLQISKWKHMVICSSIIWRIT